MTLRPLNSGNSLTQNLAQATDMFRELFAKDVVEIFKDDSGVRRVLLGKGSDGFYGLKVSKPGFDVYDATDNQLVFNSNQNVFKVVAVVDISVTAPPNTNNITSYPHGLGYTPGVQAYLTAGLSGGNTPLPTWTSITRDDINHIIKFGTWINAEVDATNVYINTFNSLNNPVGPFVVTVYLLQESAN